MRNRSDSNGGDSWGIFTAVVIFLCMAGMFYFATKGYEPIVQEQPSIEGEIEGEIEVEIVLHEGEAVPDLLICFKRQSGSILWKLNVPTKNGVYAHGMSIEEMKEERDMVVGLIDTADNKLISLYHLNGDQLRSEGYLKNKEIEWHLKGEVLRDVEIFLYTAP